MKRYMILALLHLREAVRGEDGQVLGSYYQNYGVSADSPAEAKALLEQTVVGAVIDWTDSEIREVHDEELRDPAFCAGLTAERNSIWFKSGRIFFPDSA